MSLHVENVYTSAPILLEAVLHAQSTPQDTSRDAEVKSMWLEYEALSPIVKVNTWISLLYGVLLDAHLQRIQSSQEEGCTSTGDDQYPVYHKFSIGDVMLVPSSGNIVKFSDQDRIESVLIQSRPDGLFTLDPFKRTLTLPDGTVRTLGDTADAKDTIELCDSYIEFERKLSNILAERFGSSLPSTASRSDTSEFKRRPWILPVVGAVALVIVLALLYWYYTRSSAENAVSSRGARQLKVPSPSAQSKIGSPRTPSSPEQKEFKWTASV